MANNPTAMPMGVSASAVAMELAPMPVKKTTIMASRLHLSAIQPAGMAQIPKATNPGVA